MNERIAPPISSAAAAFLARPHRPFVGGRFIDGGGDSLPVDDSATGEIVAQVPESGAAVVDQAVKAARAALEGPWGQMHGVERERLMEGGVMPAVEGVLHANVREAEPPLRGGRTRRWPSIYSGFWVIVAGAGFGLAAAVALLWDKLSG